MSRMANHNQAVSSRGSRSKRSGQGGLGPLRIILNRLKPYLAIGGILTALATLTLYLVSAQTSLGGGSNKGVSRTLFNDWKAINLTQHDLPDFTLEEIPVKASTVDINGLRVLYRLTEPSSSVTPTGRILFLLHGAAFTSKTWVDQVPTLQTMAALGHRVIAIDLPGYGETPPFSGDKAEFLEAVIKELCGLTRPVLVSPSMSGTFSLPLLEKNQDLLSGFVPVAPVSTGSYAESFYLSIHLPTLIIYGEADYGLGRESKKNLALIPTSTLPYELPKARHPAYLDQPQLWHQLIHNFMNAID